MILKRIKINAGAASETNCYIIQDENTKETMVVDPGTVTEELKEILNALEVKKIKYILLTHCHADHIGGVSELRTQYGGKVLIHINDAPGLKDINLNLCTHIGLPEIEIEEDSRLNDGDLIHLGELEFKIIHTPGHTQGSISAYCEKEGFVLSGDTLFRGAWGRTDLPTSSFEDIIASITNKLMTLPEETIVYPGHRKINNYWRRATNIFTNDKKRMGIKKGNDIYEKRKRI